MRIEAVQDAVQHGRVRARDAQPGHPVPDGDLDVVELLAQRASISPVTVIT